MTFRAPVADIVHAMRHVAGLDAQIAEGLHGDLSLDLVETVLDEAGRFANERLAPLNRLAETTPPRLENGRVTFPEEARAAYRDWAEAGWNAVPAPEAFGGQALPLLVASGCTEIWNAANMAFALCPLLTAGAIEAIAAHATPELQERYLPKLVSGEWTGTMNLTEPQAGSDLSALRTRAERAGDGTYRISGSKIYITYGEHDLADNIVHLVLARLPDAPTGTKGISLFLVPKILPDGAVNDVRCSGLEHKLGLHGSPTCTMVYGDAGGAVGWLVGEENRGLACMFTMMNNARLGVGVQGVAIAERAFQAALAYASDRRQGRAPGEAGDGMSPIAAHPDVKRMLLDMRAKIAASRALCFLTASAIDRSHRAHEEAQRSRAAARASLLTPVAKAFSTDLGIEVASTGIQVHGGMGFVEETGAAQHYRDARILTIYEGTNGIQAIDLVTRKLNLEDGAALRDLLAELRADVAAVAATNAPELAGVAGPAGEALAALERATAYLRSAGPRDVLAAATPYLRLFGVAAGAALLAREALAASRTMASAAPGTSADPADGLRCATARYFATQIATGAPGLAQAVLEGAASVDGFDARAAA